MDPHNDPASESDKPVDEVGGEKSSDKIADDDSAPAPEPAPLIPEIVPADQPLRGPEGEPPTADFSTVGTGSFFAISCSLLTVLIVFVCVAFFIIFRVF
jgi:hypothetical protein